MAYSELWQKEWEDMQRTCAWLVAIERKKQGDLGDNIDKVCTELDVKWKVEGFLNIYYTSV